MFRRGLGYGPRLAPGPRFGHGFAPHPFFPVFGLMFTALFVVAVVLMVVAFWQIFRKAGFDGPLALVMLVPGLNVAAMLFLAFAEWPVLRRLRALEASNVVEPSAAPEEAEAAGPPDESPTAPIV
jgi:hypothetical protein